MFNLNKHFCVKLHLANYFWEIPAPYLKEF